MFLYRGELGDETKGERELVTLCAGDEVVRLLNVELLRTAESSNKAEKTRVENVKGGEHYMSEETSIGRSGSGTTHEFRPITRNLEEFPLPEEAKDIPLDPSYGFEVPIDEFTATFIPNGRWFGPEGNIRAVLEEPMTAGVIVNCLDVVWFVESEPTGEEGTFGLLVYAPQQGERKRKPLLVGQGSIGEDTQGDEALTVDVRTVYDFVRSSPRADKLSGSASCNTQGVCTGTITYSYEF